MLTYKREGFIIDAGPDAVSSGYRHFLQLLDDLGLSDRVVPSSTVAGAIRHGRVYDLDLEKPLSLLFTLFLSWSAKLKFALGAMRIRPLLKGLDNFSLVDSAHRDDGKTTAKDFGLRYFGQ